MLTPPRDPRTSRTAVCWTRPASSGLTAQRPRQPLSTIPCRRLVTRVYGRMAAKSALLSATSPAVESWCVMLSRHLKWSYFDCCSSIPRPPTCGATPHTAGSSGGTAPRNPATPQPRTQSQLQLQLQLAARGGPHHHHHHHRGPRPALAPSDPRTRLY
jgi:hypothetical protein